MAAGVETSTAPVAPPVDDGGADGWRTDAQQRKYAPARGRSGVVYRQGTETIEEAHARDAKGPKDRKPRGAPKPKTAPAPTTIDAKALEQALIEALSAPAIVAAGMGDEYLADHFATHGRALARNLVAASERNPWLKQKLEALMVGEDFMVKLVTALGVGGALLSYALPPIIYLLPNAPVIGNDKAREMFGVPKRDPKPKEPADADAPPAAPAAAAERPAAPAQP